MGKLSAWANRMIGSAWALPIYVVLRVLAGWLLPAPLVTLVLSDFANIVLLLLAVEQTRQACKMEAELDALVEATPDADPA